MTSVITGQKKTWNLQLPPTASAALATGHRLKHMWLRSASCDMVAAMLRQVRSSAIYEAVICSIDIYTIYLVATELLMRHEPKAVLAGGSAIQRQQPLRCAPADTWA